MPLASSIGDRLQSVESRISAACQRAGRKPADITLVAVTKKFSADAVCEAYAAGLRDFGENYVQEFVAKKPLVVDLSGARFHLIGHLQSNKTRVAAELFDVVQTLDSVKTLQRLDAALGEQNRSMNVLLEIKLGEEESKTGASPDEIPSLLETPLSHIQIKGLMVIPPWSSDAEVSRPYFRQLAALARQYNLPELSMGMSNDFEVAIEEGATLIRVGTALFGLRPKPQ